MVEKKSVPQIRISRFTKEWNIGLLSHYLETSKAKNSDDSFTKEDVLSVSGDFGVVNQMQYHGKSFAGASLVNYGVVSTDDVVYTKSPLRYQPYGIIKTNAGNPGIVSALYAVYHPKDNVFAPFVQTYFNLNKRLNGYLLPLISKGAKNTINVSDDAALLGTVYFPERDEQQSITTLFKNLEDLIFQSQSKLEKLQQIKLSMLEKMFPKEGDEVPKVRFKEFSESWKKHKVGDFLTESRIVGNTGLTAKKLTVKLWGKGVVEKSDACGGSAHTQYYVRKAGQFMYGKLDFLHAAFGIVPDSLDGYESTLDSPAFDLSGIDGRFLMNTVIQENFYLKNGMIANGSRKAKRIHTDTFLEMDILTPSIEEQKKMGDYFMQLDKQISFAQIEIDKLQNLKKALLEKMFV